MRLDGSVPVKYGLRLNMDEKYRTLKKQLSELSGIPAMQILLVEIFGALVKVSESLFCCLIMNSMQTCNSVTFYFMKKLIF